MMSLETGTASLTCYWSEGTWWGEWGKYKVEVIGLYPCRGHDLGIVEDEYGQPTGFLSCDYCWGLADDPEYYTEWPSGYI